MRVREVAMPVAVLASACALAPTVVLAQPVDPATRASARLLGEEGLAFYDKGDCGKAVEKLTKAYDLVHAPTLAFYTGKCLEKLGRWVDASEMYAAAVREEGDPAAPATARAKADAAKARAALLPRIPMFELSVEDPAPDVKVTLDGVALPSAALGVTRPIDPGKHVAEARRGDKVLVTREFAVDEGDHGQIVLAWPKSGSPAAAPASTTSPSLQLAPTPASSASSSTSVGPWVVGGVGLAALVAGGVTGALVLVNRSSVSGQCNDAAGTCASQAGIDAANAVRTLGPATTALLVVGGAGVVAGGVWLGVRSTKKPSARVGVAAVVGGAAWRLEGSW